MLFEWNELPKLGFSGMTFSHLIWESLGSRGHMTREALAESPHF